MLDRSAGNRLFILENFQVDRTLPKFVEEQEGKRLSNREMSGSVQVVSNDFWQMSEDDEIGEEESEGIKSIYFKRGGRRRRFWLWALLGKLAFWKRKTLVPKMTVLEFFTQIKCNTQDLTVVEERAKGYELAIQQATRSGQRALIEKLRDGLNAYVAETHMLSIGIDKFVTEKTIVEFYKKCKKGLRLDYVKNFTRAIPNELIVIKEKADTLGVFDNYAVLHYDPDAKSFAETEAEKEARKDPILFGLVKGKDSLYVIGDWIDDQCDLTLDQMAEILGRNAHQKFPSAPA